MWDIIKLKIKYLGYSRLYTVLNKLPVSLISRRGKY